MMKPLLKTFVHKIPKGHKNRRNLCHSLFLPPIPSLAQPKSTPEHPTPDKTSEE